MAKSNKLPSSTGYFNKEMLEILKKGEEKEKKEKKAAPKKTGAKKK